jgi:hypothetical protein
VSPVEYRVEDVTDWEVHRNEPGGTKQNKRWLVDGDGELWLWKEITTQTTPAATWLKGEDWAEKVVAEVATVLGVPAAQVELGLRAGICGSLSRDLTDGRKVALAGGNELLAGTVPGYEAERTQQVAGYTSENVIGSFGVRGVGSPAGVDDSLGAAGWFAGYLVLDALVANTDRHHTNWAVLEDSDGAYRLAPSFDHASSLGFQLSDEHRMALVERGVDEFASRGISRHAPGRPTLVQVAATACFLTGTVTLWRDTVDALHPDSVSQILERVPEDRMSHPARRLAFELVSVNRRRLLDALAGQ